MKHKPTDSELEIMQLLWEHGPLTVRKLNDKLNEHRRVGYTTSLKIMQIMTEKGLLVRNTDHRSHVYTPTLVPEQVQSSVLDHVVKTVFRGSRSKLIIQALGSRKSSAEELAEIKALIKRLEEE
jgi:predicted transcriptional regulator